MTTLAQVGTDIASAVSQPLINAGVTGAVLWYFMVRNSTDLRDHAKAIERMARSINALVMGSTHHTESAKREASVVQSEIDDAERSRNAK